MDAVEKAIKLAGLPKKSLIFDPFMGSGTTARAALNLGMDYYGAELDQEDIDFLERELNTVLIAPIIQDARTVIIKFHASDPLQAIKNAVTELGIKVAGWQLFGGPFGIPVWALVIGSAALLYIILK